MIRHTVTLHKRHHGIHTRIRTVLVEHTSSLIVKTLYRDVSNHGAYNTDRIVDDYVVREQLLADKLNAMDVLPVPANKILLVVNNTGSSAAKVFKPWGKYFDAYSLFLEAGKRMPGHVVGRIVGKKSC